MTSMKLNDVEALDSGGYRKFGLTFAAIILFLFGFLLPWLFSNVWPIWPWFFALATTGIALLRPNLLQYLYRTWMVFGHYMGLINSKIILGLLFGVIITPVAITFKLLKKDPMNRKSDTQLKTYWEPAPKRDATHMRNIY